MKNKESSFCLACQLQETKLPFSQGNTIYFAILELIQRISVMLALNAHKYCVHFVDAYSQFTWTCLLR